MRLTRLALVAVIAAACGKPDTAQTAAADSAARDLSMPKVDTVVVYKDRADSAPPAAAPSAAAPAPKPKPKPQPAPAPAAKPAAPAAPAVVKATAPAGTEIKASLGVELSTRTNKPGETAPATVSADVVDGAGHVVVPAGSTVTLTLAQVKAGSGGTAPTLVLRPTRLTINGQGYPVDGTADITVVKEGRGVGGSEVAKTAGGAAAGAIVGGLIGKGTGAVIGGVVGGAAGAGVAAKTAKKDYVAGAGSTVVVKLADDFTREYTP